MKTILFVTAALLNASLAQAAEPSYSCIFTNAIKSDLSPTLRLTVMPGKRIAVESLKTGIKTVSDEKRDIDTRYDGIDCAGVDPFIAQRTSDDCQLAMPEGLRGNARNGTITVHWGIIAWNYYCERGRYQ